jgi:uncharacterized protein (TIGR02118 family)
MVKLIAMFKRREGMSPEDFHRYWREVHGPLVASTKSGGHARRYEQNHRPLSDYGRNSGGYDGVTEQWFTSVDDFYASLAEADFPLIDADQRKFIDTDSIAWLLTEEAEVIVG